MASGTTEDGVKDVWSLSGLDATTITKLGQVNENIRKGYTAFLVAQGAFGTAKKYYQKTKDKLRYDITIPQGDNLYAQVHRWFMDELGPDIKSVSVRSMREYDQWNDSITNFKLARYYNDNRRQTITLRGHKVEVWIEKPESTNAFAGRQEDKIHLACKNEAGYDVVNEFLTELVAKMNKQKQTHLFIRDAANWNRRDDIAKRDINTVFLKEGQKERLIEDLKMFRATKGEYVKLGTPYHRGYLLYGPPGTGKSSFVKALAQELEMDVYYLPLNDLERDNSLLNALATIEANSILLLEDIDSLQAANDRSLDDEPSKKKAISLSGLLNSLDGLSTPEGLITFMTTNHLDRLDPAVYRPGRVDMMEEISYIDDYQIRCMSEVLLGREWKGPKVTRDIAPAAISEIMKRNILKKDEAYDEIVDFLEAK